MKDAQGNTIYVGKAKDLHRRLASYFSPTGATLANHKTRALINAIASFDYFETRNDHEPSCWRASSSSSTGPITTSSSRTTSVIPS